MTLTRRLFLATGTALAAVAAHQMLLTQTSLAEKDKKDKVVNLYTARHYDADNKVYEAFFKKTGVKVNLIEAPADKLIERIKSEGANSPADVVITVDAGNLTRAKEAGILQTLNDSDLNSTIPAQYRDPEGAWYGLTKRGRVVMYNKDLVKAPASLVQSYEDLASLKLKEEGRKGVLVRSSSNIYNQSLVGSILAAQGESKTEEWAKGFMKNFARSPEGNDTAQIKALAAGLGEFAVSNTYYLARLANSSKPEEKDIASKIGIIFPNQKGSSPIDRGTHMNISGGGVAKNAPNRDHAVQFLKFLASPEAQEIFAASNYEYPIRAGVALNPTLSGFGQGFKEDKLEAATFAKNNKKALEIMDRAGWK